jgi:hypothetical protein
MVFVELHYWRTISDHYELYPTEDGLREKFEQWLIDEAVDKPELNEDGVIDEDWFHEEISEMHGWTTALEKTLDLMEGNYAYVFNEVLDEYEIFEIWGKKK